MKKTAILMLTILLGMSLSAQTDKNNSTGKSNTLQTVVIQTNGVCKKCEDLFKENVPYFKGVKDYSYDINTSKMTITFDTRKTNADTLRQQISKLGYNADQVKADPEARKKLPACCQVEKKKEGQNSGCQGHQHSGCSGHK